MAAPARTGYVSKPIDPPVLFDVMDGVLAARPSPALA